MPSNGHFASSMFQARFGYQIRATVFVEDAKACQGLRLHMIFQIPHSGIQVTPQCPRGSGTCEARAPSMRDLTNVLTQASRSPRLGEVP